MVGYWGPLGDRLREEVEHCSVKVNALIVPAIVSDNQYLSCSGLGAGCVGGPVKGILNVDVEGASGTSC